MSREFVQKALEGLGGEGAYKIDIADNVLVFCHHGFRCEGVLMGYCNESLIVDIGGACVWVSNDWVGAMGKVSPGDDYGGDGAEVGPAPEAFISRPKRKKKRKISPAGESGDDIMGKVFCDGTR